MQTRWIRSLHRDSLTEKEILSGSQWKTSWALAENVRLFVEKYGVEHVGFHTETFADHVTDMKESSRRFNSLRTHVLSERYLDCLLGGGGNSVAAEVGDVLPRIRIELESADGNLRTALGVASSTGLGLHTAGNERVWVREKG